jgi:hypothetical protein
MQMVVWIWTMMESSSTKEEDGEFKHKKANEEVIPIHLGDSFLPTPETLRKTSCTVSGAITPRAAHTTNDKGASGPLVRRHGSNHR